MDRTPITLTEQQVWTVLQALETSREALHQSSHDPALSPERRAQFAAEADNALGVWSLMQAAAMVSIVVNDAEVTLG